MKNLTWSCHVCGENRPDHAISVATGRLKELVKVEINIRYCNDNKECMTKAMDSATQGKFPKRLKKKIIKKWWEFWK